MIIRFIRWLLGYVEFSFSGGFAEGFINDCFENKINIKDIAEGKNEITAKSDIKTYFGLHKITINLYELYR